MNTIKALIIDDEPLAHDIIIQYAELLPNLEIVAKSYSATEAFSVLKEVTVDLIFLDINMPKIDGLTFVKSLSKRPAVIITSAYEEYALEGFELQVSDYLLKPFRFERFAKAVSKIEQAKVNASPSQADERIFIKVDKKQIQVNISQIYYIESFGNYVKVWLKDRFLLTPRTLNSFETDLGSSFLRIHKSFLVQRIYISHLEGNSLTLANSQLLPIGKSHRGNVKAALGI